MLPKVFFGSRSRAIKKIPRAFVFAFLLFSGCRREEPSVRAPYEPTDAMRVEVRRDFGDYGGVMVMRNDFRLVNFNDSATDAVPRTADRALSDFGMRAKYRRHPYFDLGAYGDYERFPTQSRVFDSMSDIVFEERGEASRILYLASSNPDWTLMGVKCVGRKKADLFRDLGLWFDAHDRTAVYRAGDSRGFNYMLTFKDGVCTRFGFSEGWRDAVN